MSGYGTTAPYGLLPYKGEINKIISDYVARARRLIVEQFEESEKFLGVIDTIMSEVQELENVSADMLDLFNIPIAYGENLDNIGTIVGVSRNGKTDEEYRIVIYFTMLKNRGYGQMEILVQTAHFVTENVVSAQERFPATVDMTISDTSIADAESIFNRLDDLAGAGVRINGGVVSDGLILICTEPTMINRPRTGGLLENNYQPSDLTAGRLVEHIARS